jgi:hypothetical protein
MIKIDKILVDEKIGETHFSCDLSKCKGACCTFPGEYGAPVLEEEIDSIREAVPAAMEYLSERSKAIILDEGFITETSGHFHTNCIEKKDCVFVYYQGDIALCALEKAFLDGKTNFRKPISCHLFPIRVGGFGENYIYYEKIEECDPAIINGKSHNVKIIHSVKDALIRAYGESWYNQYIETLNSLDSKV